MGRSGPAEAGRSGPEAGAAQRGSAVQLAIREPRTPPPFSYQQYRRLWGFPEGEPTAPTPKNSQHHSALANSPTPSFTRRVSARIFVCAKDTNYRREEVRRGGQRDLFPAGTAQRGRAGTGEVQCSWPSESSEPPLPSRTRNSAGCGSS